LIWLSSLVARALQPASNFYKTVENARLDRASSVRDYSHINQSGGFSPQSKRTGALSSKRASGVSRPGLMAASSADLWLTGPQTPI